ncbi:MAG: GTP-binding protein [Bacteroidota bacterium]
MRPIANGSRYGQSGNLDYIRLFKSFEMKEHKTPSLNIYLTGGFLGSGKTTAIVNACKQLIKEDRRVAVITNDQGDQQVDSGYLQGLLIPNAEVANGCFCCNYDALEEHILRLRDSALPEIVFAESVGSCTDLVATIAKPFALFHPEFRTVISVFADASLLYSIIMGTSLFIEESVQYIYKKQLEEADVLIINKIDLLNEDETAAIKKLIEESYPGKTTLLQDSFNEKDINHWLKTLADFPVPPARASLALDYDVYGEGEAALAWLDQKVSIHTVMPLAVDEAINFAGFIYRKIKKAGYTIGHLKFLLSDDNWVEKISDTTSGQSDKPIYTGHSCKHLSLLINARVQTTPQILKQIISDAILETMAGSTCRIVTEKENAFQPGYPKPLHRIAE